MSYRDKVFAGFPFPAHNLPAYHNFHQKLSRKVQPIEKMGNLHITAAYFGSLLSDQQLETVRGIMEAIVPQYAAFHIRLGKLFQMEGWPALCLEVIDEDNLLFPLVQEIHMELDREEVPFSRFKRFIPHLTVANDPKKLPLLSSLPSCNEGSILITKMELYHKRKDHHYYGSSKEVSLWTP